MKKIKNYFYRLKVKRAIKNKIAEADFMKLTTGKRHYVLPVKDGDYMVVNDSFVNFFNKHSKEKTRNVTIQDIIRESIYQTK